MRTVFPDCKCTHKSFLFPLCIFHRTAFCSRIYFVRKMWKDFIKVNFLVLGKNPFFSLKTLQMLQKCRKHFIVGTFWLGNIMRRIYGVRNVLWRKGIYMGSETFY